MFKNIVIGIFLFGASAVLLLQIDDDLNPEVAAFLEQAEPAEQSEAYLYLLGIVAAEGEDPLTVGKQLFADIQQAEKDYQFGGESFGYEGYPEDKKLALPQGELFCGYSETCWQAILESEHNIESILQANATLLDRYQTFIKMRDYATLSKPLLVESLPPFEFLTMANKLVILKAISTARTAGPEQAIKIIMENILKLRHNLKRADSIIGKIIYTVVISDNLDALSLLTYRAPHNFNINILPISLAEQDFSTVMAREFAMGYDMFADMDRNPDFFATTSFNGEEAEGSSPGWWVRIFFKPNMTANDRSLFYEEIAIRSKLEQIEFARVNFENLEAPYLKLSSIRNYAGNILNSIASPYFDKYIAKLFDLNTKIAIFNQTANKSELPVDLGYIQNPYYGTGGTAYYSEDGKSICLTGPLEDGKNQRCLRMKL